MMRANKSIQLYPRNSLVQATSQKERKKDRQFFLVKRIVDIFLAVVGMIIAIPIVLFFIVLIVIETPGSPFYIQRRVGKDGEIFNLIKLRSMTRNAEVNGEKWAEVNDLRITKVGSFIRKTRIDELPQLFNVLKGDMSMIGPRPERPSFTAQFDKEIKGFSNRLVVKPGLTGLAQINGGYDISPREKLEYDLEYIANLNLKMEIKILLKTVKVIFTGEGAR